jgi:hypothetical protein
MGASQPVGPHQYHAEYNIALCAYFDTLVAAGEFTIAIFLRELNALINKKRELYVHPEVEYLMNMIQADDIVKKYTPAYIETLTGCQPDAAIYNDIIRRINIDLCSALAMKVGITLEKDISMVKYDLKLTDKLTGDDICTYIARIYDSGCDLHKKRSGVCSILDSCLMGDYIIIGNYALEKMRGVIDTLCVRLETDKEPSAVEYFTGIIGCLENAKIIKPFYVHPDDQHTIPRTVL